MEVARLSVALGVDAGGFRRGITSSVQTLGGLESTVKRVDGTIGGLNRTVVSVGARVKSAFSATPLAGLASIAGVVAGLKSAFAAADSFDASIRRLSATATLTGQNLGFLQKTTLDAKKAFGLSTGVAAEFTSEILKLTSKAGAVDQTSAALGAFLDLGAARGLSASATLQAVSQAILGIDEGTDKLFGANPSVLYEQFAKSVGKSAGQLTDAGKAQAILAAGMRDGGKVAGEYAKWLKSPAGEAYQLSVQTDEAKAKIGRMAEGIRRLAIPALSSMVGWIVEGAVQVATFGARLPVAVGHIRVWAAELDEATGGAVEKMSGHIARFGAWVEQQPTWLRVLLGVGNLAAPVGRSLGSAVAGGVEQARADLQRLRAASEQEISAIRKQMSLTLDVAGSTNPLQTLAKWFDETEKKLKKGKQKAEEFRVTLENIGDVLAARGTGLAGVPEVTMRVGKLELDPEAVKRFNEDAKTRAQLTAMLDLKPKQVPAAPAMETPGRLAQFGSALRSQVSEAISNFGALAAAAAVTAPFFDGLRQALGPVLEPMRILGQLIGTTLAPALHLLLVPVRLIGIGFSYVTQAMGWFVEGVGKLIDKLLPDWISKAGKSIVKAGQDMQDSAKEARRALAGTAEAADKLTASISNMPPIFDLALRRRQAMLGGSAAPTYPGTSGGAAGGGGGGGVVINVNNPAPGVDGIGIVRQMKQALRYDPELRFLVAEAAV